MIQLNQVTKVYHAGKSNAFNALNGIDLTVEANTVTALIGPSGSGKTTLIKVMAGLLKPTKGRVRVNGKVERRRGHRLAVGDVVQVGSHRVQVVLERASASPPKPTSAKLISCDSPTSVP